MKLQKLKYNLFPLLIIPILIFTLLSLWHLQTYTLISAATKPLLATKASITNKISTIAAWETIEETPADREISIIIGGDSLFVAELGEKIKRGLDPFKNIKNFWQEFDLRVINLETNISTPGKFSPAAKPYTFNSPKATVQQLAAAPVDAVSLANNHAMDFGAGGLKEQMQLLANGGVKYFGVGKNLNSAYQAQILERNNTKIAFLGFNNVETYYTNAKTNRAGTAPFYESRVKAAITQAQQDADVVIVYPHWGIEHVLSPSNEQRIWAKKFIDFGADIVVGAHPHVTQGSESYKGKKIYYSLGNFIFIGMWNRPNAMQGKMLELTIQNKEITETKLHPYHLDNEGLPTFD